jgi:hypothetical protein
MGIPLQSLDAGLTQFTTGMAWWYRKYANEQLTCSLGYPLRGHWDRHEEKQGVTVETLTPISFGGVPESVEN